MNRIVLGAVAALSLAAAGLFWWQGRAASEKGDPPPAIPEAPPSDEALPFADAAGMRGPAPPQASEQSREQRRFDRLDRDRDGRITGNEMLAPRAGAFRKLDADGNNLLTFQEWSVRTSSRFKGADGNRDGALTREEFARTKPKPGKQPNCRCDSLRSPVVRQRPPAARAAATLVEPDPDYTDGEEENASDQ